MKTKLTKEIEEIIDSIWLDIGAIHSKGLELNSKDLDNIRNEKVKILLSLLLQTRQDCYKKKKICPCCGHQCCCNNFDSLIKK